MIIMMELNNYNYTIISVMLENYFMNYLFSDCTRFSDEFFSAVAVGCASADGFRLTIHHLHHYSHSLTSITYNTVTHWLPRIHYRIHHSRNKFPGI